MSLPTDLDPVLPKSLRHKCPACYKQYKDKKHLIEHVEKSYHSVHQPKCAVCNKHCKTLESVREHLRGPLAKAKCAAVFATLGCDFCLAIFDNSDTLGLHKTLCSLAPPVVPELMIFSLLQVHEVDEPEIFNSAVLANSVNDRKLIAMDCEMVGGGSDGTLDLCARVCLINENEDVILHSYIKPIIPVTDYRTEVTGITEDHMRNAESVGKVRKKVREILCNGEESSWRMNSNGGNACFLIGHSVEHDLYGLEMNYPKNLIRDTAEYIPLQKTNWALKYQTKTYLGDTVEEIAILEKKQSSHSLKYLTKTYLGYEIQSALHNPYEDCVAVMRLYKRIRSQTHESEGGSIQNDCDIIYDAKRKSPYRRSNHLLQKSPDELLEMSRPLYKCWCLDTRSSTCSYLGSMEEL